MSLRDNCVAPSVRRTIVNPQVGRHGKRPIVDKPIEPRAELFGHAGRSGVVWMDHAAYLLHAQIGEAPVERRPARLRRNAPTLTTRIDGPADFEHRPALGKPRPAASEKPA